MARSSVIIHEKVSKADILAIREVARVDVNFDATHRTSEKKPHFDIGVFIEQNKLKYLGEQHQATFNKFRFGTQEVYNQIPNQIKYEVSEFNQDMIPANKKPTIDHAINEANVGRKGGFIQDIF